MQVFSNVNLGTHPNYMMVPPLYGDAWYFSEGLARVELNGKCGYIDKESTQY
jgi:hypothetical protein